MFLFHLVFLLFINILKIMTLLDHTPSGGLCIFHQLC